MTTNPYQCAVKSDARGLVNLFELVEVFRDVRPEIPMQMAAIFLAIALRPGISQADLILLTGMSQSAISRNIMAMSARTRQGKAGLGLVMQRHDPMDGRAYEQHLTKGGRALADRLLSTCSA